MKTSELQGAALDWAVAINSGYSCAAAIVALRNWCGTGRPYTPSSNWAQGGPIIEREVIATHKKVGTDYWVAVSATKIEMGPTPLIAAMRCYVASKLGENVEVPEELKL